MDQLRDSIGFRAFSQREPKIEYKREGSALFQQMVDGIRDKVTDFVFKARITPQISPPASPPPSAPAPAPRPASAAGTGPSSSAGLYTPPTPVATPTVAGVIAGPGINTVVAAPPAPGPTGIAPGAIAAAAASTPPMSERQQRDLEAAQRAGTPGGEAARSAPVVKSEKRYGRNDTCPQGCGRKYKKCCNRPDGTCTGQGLTNPAADGDED
jgi:preprotein translocase subunit SecA